MLHTLPDKLPFWALFIVITALILLALEGGVRLGIYRRSKSKDESNAPVGAAVGAIFALLAFLLGFSFSAAAERFEARRGLVLLEANAIGTTYLRAGLVQEPQRSEIRKLLREYVDVTLHATTGKNPQSLGNEAGEDRLELVEEGIEEVEVLQNKLWAQATILAEQNGNSEIVALFIESLNEVIDLHTKRVMSALWTRIPNIIWLALIFLAVVSMGAMGYHSGLIGVQSFVVSFALVFCFSAVLVLIADLDRPFEGMLQVGQRTMIELQKKM